MTLLGEVLDLGPVGRNERELAGYEEGGAEG